MVELGSVEWRTVLRGGYIYLRENLGWQHAAKFKVTVRNGPRLLALLMGVGLSRGELQSFLLHCTRSGVVVATIAHSLGLDRQVLLVVLHLAFKAML